jgi:hypothetical protein
MSQWSRIVAHAEAIADMRTREQRLAALLELDPIEQAHVRTLVNNALSLREFWRSQRKGPEGA